MTTIKLIINKKAGQRSKGSTTNIEDEIVQKFNNHNINAEVHKIENEKLEELVQDSIAQKIDAIVAVGGDGTLSSVASALVDKEIPLGILPLGTLNHFAKDLNIPLMLEEAIEIITENNIQKIDVGEVNGKIFINNSSIGFYPKIVRKREKEINKFGGNKWIAMGSAMIKLFPIFPFHHVNVKTDKNSNRCKTPFVFVGNNEYAFDFLNLGGREKLNEGKLSLYYPDTSGRISMFKFAFLALINKLNQTENFNCDITDAVTIEVNKKVLLVSIDGEVVKLKPPLEYNIKPGALKVIVPKGG